MFTLTSRGCRRCVVWLGSPIRTTPLSMAASTISVVTSSTMRKEDLNKPFINNVPVAVARL